MTGKAFSDHLAHFTFRYFHIDTELLKQHPIQRPINSVYIDNLVETFEFKIIQRTENVGVMIKLEEGWR